jgi:signal transduction histidine kinase
MEVMTDAAITLANQLQRSMNQSRCGEASPLDDALVLGTHSPRPAVTDRRMAEVLAVLAHELRSPLAAIHFAAEVVREFASDAPELAQCVGVIERQVKHVGSLVENFLEAGRIANGKVSLGVQLVELIEILGRAVEMSRPVVDARRHELRVSLPPEPVWLWGDRTRLMQVAVNLLNNAAKYTDPGGCISVTLADVGVGVVLRVRDNGLGIAPEMLEQIFDLYAQAGHSLERSQGGVGIGLALARMLVELHGGSIYAFSAGAGQGSEFVVYLPRRSGNSARIRAGLD